MHLRSARKTWDINAESLGKESTVAWDGWRNVIYDHYVTLLVFFPCLAFSTLGKSMGAKYTVLPDD